MSVTLAQTYRISDRNSLIYDLDETPFLRDAASEGTHQITHQSVQSMVASGYCLETLATTISRAAGALPIDSSQRGQLEQTVLILLQLQRNYRLTKQ